MKTLITWNCRLLLALLSLIPVWLHAQPVSESEALLRAREFLMSPPSSSASARRAPQQIPLLHVALTGEAYYVVNDAANGSYVVVSSDERVSPILGYSFDGVMDVEQMPCNLRAWLAGYDLQLREFKKAGRMAPARSPFKATSDDYLGNPIGYLLSTKWDQRAPYYNQTPTISGMHCLTGCVATAMAQVMYFHKWPAQTKKPIPRYTTKSYGLEVPSIGITNIEWGNMLSSYSTSHHAAADEAVATLMKLCGAAVEMNYGLSVSDASFSVQAFVEYFDYAWNTMTVPRERYSDISWERLIYKELAARRPVLYSGGVGSAGHAFVVDGYDSDGFFHINLGWGGQQDGFFQLQNLLSYNANQWAFVGLQPSASAPPQQGDFYAMLDDNQLTFFYGTEDRNPAALYFSVDYEGSTAPWHEFKDEVWDVVIEPSFADCRLKNMAGFFMDFSKMETITGMEYLNTSEVTNMNAMFSGCKSLMDLDVSHFNTEKVTNMGLMFLDCRNLMELDVSHFNTEKVTYMSAMFYGCRSLQELDLTHFDTSATTLMAQLFYHCDALTELDLSHFNTSKVTNMYWMFHSCGALKTIYVGDGWSTASVKYATAMFKDCHSLVGEQGTAYDASHDDSQYARVDQGSERPGYLTKWDETGISVPAARRTTWREDAFRLDGMRVPHRAHTLPAGVYIVNGRKVLRQPNR